MQTTLKIYCISTSFLDGFSGYALSDEKKIELLERLKFLGSDEAVILNTCNRFEIYFTSSEETAVKISRGFRGKLLTADDATRHAVRVAAGLESMLPGEKQILEQFKDAYRFSRDMGYASGALREIFMHAYDVGKKVRAKTGLPSLSLGNVAVEYANAIEGLQGKRVFILGAGKMGVEIALALEHQNIKDFTIASRSLDKAREVGHGKPVEFAEMVKNLKCADIIFAAASCPIALLKYDDVKLAQGKEISIFDISAPSSVEERVATLGNIRYRSLRELKKFIDGTSEYAEFASRAERILENGGI